MRLINRAKILWSYLRGADRVDGLLRQVFIEAGTSQVPVTIVALGGYGRRHLCLHSDIDVLVLHYTGMQFSHEAIHRLCDPKARVSCHYVVLETGSIVQLVQEGKRAWHAGSAGSPG